MNVYAAYRGGLHVIDVGEEETVPVDADESVGTEHLLDGCDVECLAVHPDTPQRAFAGTFGSGVYRLLDGGESVERIGEGGSGSDGGRADGSGSDGGDPSGGRADGIGPDAVTAIALSPTDPDELWVGTEPSRVYRSTDGGDSFERLRGLTAVPSASEWSFPPRPDTHHVRWIEPCPDDSDRWYVGIEAGALVLTPDAGESWIDRPTGSRRDNHTLATHPDAPDRVYSAAGDGYAESDDRGETWTTPQEELDHRYVWGLAVDPGDPDTVLASSASGPNAAHSRGDAYLYRKRGASQTSGGSGEPAWERLDGRGIPVGAGTYRAVLAAGTESGEVWALHNRGLYRTTDAGDRFDRVPVDLPESVPRALAVVE